MTDASFALRKAVYARLTGTPALIALLGGARIHDEVPRALEPPCIATGEGSVADWSTSSDRGHEHRLSLSIWSKEGGAREALAIANTVIAALEAMPAALDGHRLVNLVAVATDVRREAERRLVRATIRIRAVTELA